MKKWLKRMIAAGLTVCLLLALIPFVRKDRESSTLEVSASDSTPMVRGVVDSLHELPHYQNETNRAAARGTAEHPFVVLEVVPYEELAEFGYKVSGLEPVAVDEMYGRQDMRLVGSVGDAIIEQNAWYFFMEEPEAQDYETRYDFVQMVHIEEDSSWQTPYYGYYEMVEEGTGKFRAQEISVSAVSVAHVGTGTKPLDGADIAVQDGMPSEVGTPEPDAADNTGNTDLSGAADVPLQTVGEEGLEVTEEVEGTEDLEGAQGAEEAEGTEVLEGTEALDGVEGTETLDGTEEIDVTESTEAPEMRQLLFEREDGGNLIWHTVNDGQADYETAKMLAGDMNQRLEQVGDRFYTTRTPSNDDPAIWVNYMTYEHKEAFLIDTLKLSPEAAANYSIVLKTITPRELNASPEWIDYADLLVMSPGSHVNGLPALWQKYNRLHKAPTVDVNAISSYGFSKVEDLTWDVTMKIFDRVTAEEDYAALVMDNGVYYNYDQKRNVTVDVLDWNMDSSGWTVSPGDAGGSNLYKLAVMLLCMDHSLFRSLYLSGESPVIQNGVNTKQTGDAAAYWSPQTFLLVPPSSDRIPGYWDANSYWGIRPEGAPESDPPLIWTNYKMMPILSTTEDWVSDHVYCYHTSSDFTQSYSSSQLNLKYETEFDGTDGNTPADAVRFILGTDTREETVAWKETLRILDIEPCVNLVWNGSINEPDWVLTETYLRMLLPTFRGEIEITHQTTAEFNGKTEDLNSTYDMIYLGLDFGAYNTKSMGLMLDGEMRWNVVYPDWNDNSMDGLIYFHNGDKIAAAEQVTDDGRGRTRSVHFLWNPSTNQNAVTTEGYFGSSIMRFPGNDISMLKKQELEDFLVAGYPIVATRYLYNLEDALIAGNTNIRAFVADKKGSGVYSTAQTAAVTEAAARAREVVNFTLLPNLYNGETSGTVIVNPNYLPTSAGRSYLEFSFDVAEAGYNYSIYIDQDANSKFTVDEVVRTGQTRVGQNNFTYRLASTMVGLIQWKIEVYRRDRPQERYVMTGCSAARNNSGTKKQINVLQIMPDNTSTDGSLNLSQSMLFRKYYQDLIDYDVSITSICWWEFNRYFEGSGFHFDLSKDISGGSNPVNEDKINPGANLGSYNMIIVGFGDTYGGTNLSNNNGAVEYLEYWIAQGKGILFTHDITSVHNVAMEWRELPFGHTANSMLRDEMGMNRYQMISNQLNNNQRQAMRNYQTAEGYYDTPYDVTAGHGFTYYAMKRLSWKSSGEMGWDEANWRKGYHMPYRYMITNPEGNTVCTAGSLAPASGINNNNDLTTTASKLNDGQITSYPYLIDDTLPIAQTHGQWYELNMEDPDVTVWYCLGDDHRATGWNATDTNGQGTALTYGVSPNDAANNYYIYSKGNIFYSGVGHSTVTGDMEAKLFINTMISAYSAAAEPPVVEITNPDAAVTGVQSYMLGVMQEFDNDTAGGTENSQVAEMFDENDFVTVTFATIDFNTVTTSLEGRIRRADGVYIDRIVRLSDGAVLLADADHKFTGLSNGGEYSLDYPKKDLENCRTVYFELKNNKIETVNTTTLNMTIEPLFELD